MSTVKEPLSPKTPSLPAAREARKTILLRALLFVWAVLIACPFRHWPIEASTDNTWIFALNDAAAHGLALGRDVVWTTGPLGYLVFPQDIGRNLTHALIFQIVMWAVLIGILADLFYRSGIALRNLVFFTLFFSLSAPLFWFNYMGPENLLLAAALVLLVRAKFQGGTGRLVVALVMAGVIPLIKLTGGMLALGAIAGFLLERMIQTRGRAWREVALAVVVPAVTAGIGCWLFMPSLGALANYWRASAALADNYSVAMSLTGDPFEFGAAVEILLGLAALLFMNAKQHRRDAWFFVTVLAIPIFLSFKHGFVRQDVHVINFIFFVGLALGLVSLAMPLDGRRRSMVASLVLLNFGLVSLEYMVARVGIGDALAEATGFRGMSVAFDLSGKGPSQGSISEADRVEPALRAIIGDSPVSSLSVVYSQIFADKLNLQLYPVLQRYAAFTPYLDGLNAAWIHEKRPRFLIFDGLAIDHRHPWAETPTLWLEVYRWYDTRLLGTRNLLLERRNTPRFDRVVSTSRFDTRFAGGFEIPESATPVLWSLECHLSAVGSLEKLLFRVPPVLMSINGKSPWRVIPDVLASPVIGNLPGTLADFAALMTPSESSNSPATILTFEGSGLRAYAKVCHAQLWSLQ